MKYLLVDSLLAKIIVKDTVEDINKYINEEGYNQDDVVDFRIIEVDTDTLPVVYSVSLTQQLSMEQVHDR